MSEEKKISGLAKDGTEYTADSAEVKKFKEIFADVTDEAAIGSVVNMHNAIAEGEDPAGEAADEVEKMIREKIDGVREEEEATEEEAA